MMLPSVRLLHGDCLEVMPTLPASSVQMVFADLPYGVTQNTWDISVNLAAMWRGMRQAAMPHAALIFSCQQPFTSILASSNLKQLRYDLVWHKTNRSTGFLNAKRMPLRAHETLLLFSQKRCAYAPQMTTGKPFTVSAPAPENNGRNYGAFVKKRQVNVGTRFPISVLPVACEHGKHLHPTQKPVALLEWLIRTYTNEGDTVLDPVMGSGTTGVACLNTGRHFIGIEKDARYFAVASKRIADRQAGMQACLL